MTRARWWWIVAALPTLFLGYLFVYPLGRILATSLFPDGQPTLGAFMEVAARPGLRGALWFTVWQAVASTVLTLVAAFPLTYVLARSEFP
ncbi:MAG: hypothetical protein ACRDVM_08935, partial [Acidimicrobiia bacterium]